MKILVTGGAGYIGSHACVQLIENGYEIVVIDNLSNSSPKVLERIEQLTEEKLEFHQVDILDRDGLKEVFKKHEIGAVIHFAGLKAVGESVEIPWKYYQNNVSGTLVLLDVMKEFGTKNIIFSSSATVYGLPEKLPITEDFPLQQTNPYGATKAIIERILIDIQEASPDWNVAILRYFNPVGAHKSGWIGEDPKGTPNNLMPYLTQVAVGKRESLQVFGDDYDTDDGTGVRDYIHVEDLVSGHIKAVEKLNENPGLVIYNLGTGQGYSVLDLVKAFEQENGIEIPYTIVARRAGDIAASYADPSKANKELGWKAEKNINDMVRDAWNWQKSNPEGYD
jgi:UDP-glucose 4-epimerase